MRIRSRFARRLSIAVLALLTVAVGAPLLLPDEPVAVHARRYKKYGPRCYGRQRYVQRCKSGCAAKASIIKGCARRAATSGMTQCTKTFKALRLDCAGDAQCKADAVFALRRCKAEVRHSLTVDVRSISRRRYGTPACVR